MFFEGSEKKIEIVVRPGGASLRALGQAYWQNIVHKARAEILSHMSNEHCDAYLLSESSLFVWDNRFLMLTCGTTTLVDAALEFVQDRTPSALDFFSYQRKNEYQPNLQHTTVATDLQKLRHVLPVKAHQLGHLDTHHHFLFHYQHPDYQAPANDMTCELLMYHISGEIGKKLGEPHLSIQTIRSLLALDTLLPGFQLDDFIFEPCGYSINAIRGSQYATIHITPQQCSSYVSFETNLDLEGTHAPIVAELLNRLKPRSWDTVGFNRTPRMPNQDNMMSMGGLSFDLTCGYHVSFHYYLDPHQNKLPLREI